MTTTTERPRVAILGGGMAALTTALELSGEGWRDEFCSITVYQRGWRLGGKGASSRGAHGRIEEHGLHVLLGYYDNAFRVIRSVYDELDRERTDPDCPIREWRDAVHPSPVVGVEDHRDGTWHHWLATFPSTDDAPGSVAPPALTPIRFVEHAARLVLQFVDSVGTDQRADRTFSLSGVPEPPQRSTIRLIGVAGAAAIAGVTKLVGLVDEFVEGYVPRSGAVDEILAVLDGIRDGLVHRTVADVATGRILDLVDLVVTSVRGILVDGLLAGPIGFPAIDHLDFRDWLATHGALDTTTDSALVRGLYDLVFAYRDGDPDRPAFAAGLGLFLAGKLFFDYRGSLFWKMSAGMGDVVFAPMLQLLRRRGVDVEFLHRVDRLELDATGQRVERVHLGRQGRPSDPSGRLDPLIRVHDLPCFPSVLPGDRLVSGIDATLDLEHHDHGPVGDPVVLHAGADFDLVVLAVSLGAIPHVASELVERVPAWRCMVDAVRTVPTQALQLWLRPPEAALGWPVPGAVVSGFVTPFDTYASMTHLLPVEDWPDHDRPETIAYFCSALEDTPGAGIDEARANARRFVGERLGQFFPDAVAHGDFDWDLLCGASDAVGSDRLLAQHVVAAVDPSDRYVQSLPGSGRHRMRPDRTGVANLIVAGDWVSSGLDAGCLEAAALAGVQAANAVRGRPLRDGVLGTWPKGDE